MMVCPVCNTMSEPNFICDKCSSQLSNKGRVEDYLGPYSADMPIEDHYYCEHYYKCSLCGRLEKHDIKMINY